MFVSKIAPTWTIEFHTIHRCFQPVCIWDRAQILQFANYGHAQMGRGTWAVPIYQYSLRSEETSIIFQFLSANTPAKPTPKSASNRSWKYSSTYSYTMIDGFGSVVPCADANPWSWTSLHSFALVLVAAAGHALKNGHDRCLGSSLFFVFAKSSTWADTSTVKSSLGTIYFAHFSKSFPHCLRPRSTRVRCDLIIFWVLHILKERLFDEAFSEKFGLLCIQLNFHPAKQTKNIQRQANLTNILQTAWALYADNITYPSNHVPGHDHRDEEGCSGTMSSFNLLYFKMSEFSMLM